MQCDTHCECNLLSPLLLFFCSVFLLDLFLAFIPSFLLALLNFVISCSIKFLCSLKFFNLNPSYYLCLFAVLQYSLYLTYLTALFTTFILFMSPFHAYPVITAGIQKFTAINSSFIFPTAQPTVGKGLFIMEASRSHSHTTYGMTPLDQWWTWRRDLYLTQQSSQETEVHAHAGIRTRSPSKRAAADPRPRGHGHCLLTHDNNKYWTCLFSPCRNINA
jgi:hypothetical protein